MNVGFFNDSIQFRHKFVYWHYMPGCWEIGHRNPVQEAAFGVGIQVQDYLVFLHYTRKH
jgi:hypothetical protein